jgi:murein DD-endopeptidase MepM/ murein hydrolase activator NlpD
MAAMAKLVQDRKIRFIGVSNFSAKRMVRADEALRAIGLRVVSNQVHYSLLNRKIEANGILDPRQLQPGMELFVPGAPRPLEVPPLAADAGGGTLGSGPAREVGAPEVADAPSRNGRMRWPLRGVLYRGYGVRQGQRHDGIDIAAPEGSTVQAAAPGEVMYTGRQSGYGVIVILQHPGGLVTLYAHNSAVLVKEGDRVEAGTPIARVGQSGRTTGPHLHFEVREGTKPRNPLGYLPQ